MSVLFAHSAVAPVQPAVDIYLDLFTGTGTSVGTSTVLNAGQAKLSDLKFTIAGLSGGETIAVSATLSDGVAVSAANMVVTQVSDGNDVAPSALANGSFYVKLKLFPQIRSLTFTKSAGVNSCSVAVTQAVSKPTAL